MGVQGIAKKYRDDLTEKSKSLRNEPTEAERILWAQIKQRGLKGHKFRRQQPIGEYIVDFVCFEEALIIELDGGQHQAKEVYDGKRDEWLASEGFEVLRFWNNEVTENLAGVIEKILETLAKAPTP